MDAQHKSQTIPHVFIESPSTYLPTNENDRFRMPKDSDLASSIVEGKKALDQETNFSLVEVSPLSSDLPPVKKYGNKFKIISSKALPLNGPFSRRKIDGSFLWVDIENGRLVVLDHDQDELMSKLSQGSPLDSIPNKALLKSVLALLVRAGFVRGITGYTDKTIVDAKRFLRIHLTDRCNLSCVHCYTDSSPYVQTDNELPPNKWIELITEFAGLGGERILFTGGEALSYSGCDTLLQHAKSLGLHVTLFTNGILVPKYLDVICDNVDEVQVSIDGASPTSNDPIRGSGSFGKAVKAIDLLAQRGVFVRVSTVAMKSNWDNLIEKYHSFISRWDKKLVTFKINYGVMTHGRGETLSDELNINETRPIIDKMMSNLYPNDRARIVRSTSGCGFAEQIVVAPNGEVHPCHLMSGAVAHLGEDSMSDALDNLHLVNADYSVDSVIGCKGCDIRHLCGGTCRIDNGKISGNLRVTYCDADEKRRKLVALKRTFE